MTPPRGYRLIAIDLDGTLLSPQGKVTPRTRAAVQRAVTGGMFVCFATGRSWRESIGILDDVGHKAAAVFVTGAVIVDTHRSVTLHRRLMGGDLARQVSRFFELHGETVLALQDSPQADVDYLVTEAAELNPATHQWLKMTRTTVRRHPDLGMAIHDETVRVSIVSDEAAVARCEADMARQFAGRLAWHNIVLPSSGLRVMEVFEPAVNKWQGVRDVAAHHGVDVDQIVAVGDDINDLPMLRQAGLGVAMGNAVAAAKAAAGLVIGPNSEDGLAAFLEELLDNKAAKGLALSDGRRT